MRSDKVFFKTLNTILNQQMNDIWNAFKAKADILCLVGCMNMIEFIGGISNGELGLPGKVKSRFKAGFDLLSENFGELICANNELFLDNEDMWWLRCSLTHQYTPITRRHKGIMIERDQDKAILFLNVGDQSTDKKLSIGFPVDFIINGVGDARDALLSKLKEDVKMRERAKKSSIEIAQH